MTTKALLFVFILFLCLPLPGKILALKQKVDPAFKDYVEDFILRSEGRISPLHFNFVSIEFADLDYTKKQEGVIGMCYWTFPAKIQIDRTYWKEASPHQQWAVAFHEIGHCVCNRQHTADADSLIIKWLELLGLNHEHRTRLRDNCPISLMHPTDLPDWCLKTHQKYYVKEMFARCSPYL